MVGDVPGVTPESITRNRPSAKTSLLHALSVDVEEHFQVEAFSAQIRPEEWERHPSRVVQNTERVLDLFTRHNVVGTFFIVGWVAERHPGLVRSIASAGHEVGCHSYLHQHITRLTPEQFRQDTRRAKQVIEESIGIPIEGYRAPTFSIVESTLWALEILHEEGFRYDSSVFPIRHDLYGIPAVPKSTFRWELPSGAELIEVPAGTVQWHNRTLPVGGGGWLRLLPMWYTRWALRQLHEVHHRPAMVYFHPWEVDPGQPRIPSSWKSRTRHYTNLGRMESRLERLLRWGEFGPIRQVIAQQLVNGALPQWAVGQVLAPAQA